MTVDHTPWFIIALSLHQNQIYMKKGLSLFFAAGGWLLLFIFLVSGNYYNKFNNDSSASFVSPIKWVNHLDMFKGVIQCSLSNKELRESKTYLKNEIFSKVIKKSEIQNGYTYYFDDDPILLNNLLEYIQKEKSCCPFFKFDISILPFSKGLAIQISGSKDAIKFLQDFEDNEL